MTTTAEKLHDQEIIEYVSSQDQRAELDVDQAIIRGVKILGYHSRNGRTYSDAAIRTALHMYEGAKVNVNHPKGDPAKPRDYQERFGTLRSVKIHEDKGLYGDLHYNPHHPVAAQLQWDAKNSPDSVGLSHNVLARTRRSSAGKVVVETILKVNSVDLVADPATTGGLFEAKKNQIEDESEQATIIDERAQKKIVTEDNNCTQEKISQPDEQLTMEAVCLENKQLHDEVTNLQQQLIEATKKNQLQQRIEAAKLPSYLVTEMFLSQLIEAEIEEQDRLIEDRRQISKCCRPITQPPCSISQQEAENVTGGTSTLDPAQRVQRWRGEQVEN